jgi:hypothetical protein
MRVKIDRLLGLRNKKLIDATIDEILSEAADDPVYMSDLLINWEKTSVLVRALMEEDAQNKYVLQVLCDEWGQPVKPGDKVSRKFKRPLVKDAVPTPSSELKSWKDQGIYEKKRYLYEYYEVDAKGCIHVRGRDCEYFLRRWGVHSISGKRISAYPKARSAEKAKDPKDGQKKYVHYHRYKEMTKEMYEALPVLTNQNDKGHQKHK